MPESSAPRLSATAPSATSATSTTSATHLPQPFRNPPVLAPTHAWYTSPARSHPNRAQAKELPLHLILLILEYLDDVADIARITRTSRLFYYMTLPRLYQEVTLHSYADIRYIDGRPEGYGYGSPFAVGLNTLVTRNFTDYVESFRLIGEWREHDVDDYSKGRVPDNSMILQVALRAALDRMKNLKAFAWQLNTKPLQSVYESLMHKPSLTSLTLRCPTRRIPRPATTIPPLPNLLTFVIYDIDPLCYPDNISLLFLSAKRLANLKMHWSPRMRESGEESVNLLQYFGRVLAAKHQIPLKRLALWNLYSRNQDEGFENISDPTTVEEMTFVNSMGSSDPRTVFLDETWKLRSHHQMPKNLKMMKTDSPDKEHIVMLSKMQGLERLYLLSRASKPISSAATPSTPFATNVSTPYANGTTSAQDSPATEYHCKSLASDYLAVIQSNHYTMRHLLLSPKWRLSSEAIKSLCKACPNLEQLGLASDVPPLQEIHDAFALTPKLWAVRMLVSPGSEAAERIDNDDQMDMHLFALATELWRPGYKALKYFGIGDKVFKLGDVVFPPKGRPSVPEGQERSMNARRAGPMRKIEEVDRASVDWIEIWGMDTIEFDPKF